MKPEKKKLAKRKKREKKKADQQSYVQRLEYEQRLQNRLAEYPSIVFDAKEFDENKGDHRFVDIIKEAAGKIDFSDSSQFSDVERRFF